MKLLPKLRLLWQGIPAEDLSANPAQLDVLKNAAESLLGYDYPCLSNKLFILLGSAHNGTSEVLLYTLNNGLAPAGTMHGLSAA